MQETCQKHHLSRTKRDCRRTEAPTEAFGRQERAPRMVLRALALRVAAMLLSGAALGPEGSPVVVEEVRQELPEGLAGSVALTGLAGRSDPLPQRVVGGAGEAFAALMGRAVDGLYAVAVVTGSAALDTPVLVSGRLTASTSSSVVSSTPQRRGAGRGSPAPARVGPSCCSLSRRR